METQTTELQSVKQATLLFEEHVQLTGIRDFGLSWEALNEGRVKVPGEGARFDISFEGDLKGPRIEGRIRGVDYLTIRADGRFMLRIYATVITKDGEAIALEEDGILIPGQNGSTVADLQFNMKFTTAAKAYSWINNIPVWAVGRIDRQTGSVYIRAFTV